jgi:nitroreductase
MAMKTFDELLKNRRSIRKFKNKRVHPELINTIIHDSTMAPSSGNEQPWQFIVVSNRSFLNEISQDCKKSLLKRIADNPNDYASKYKTLLTKKEYNIFYNAPVLVLIVGSNNLKNTEINCTLAASYLMFSAVAHGLGTCWISFARFIQNEKIKEKLCLNGDHLIVAPIIIGYPETIPQTPNRKPAEILKIIE